MGAPIAMSDDRFDIMAAVAQRLRAGMMPPAGRLEHPGSAPVPAPVLSREELVAHFTTEAEALTVVVHRAADDAAASAKVSEVVGGRGAGRVLAWQDKWLNCGGLADYLRSAGVALESCWLPRESVQRQQRL